MAESSDQNTVSRRFWPMTTSLFDSANADRNQAFQRMRRFVSETVRHSACGTDFLNKE